MAAGTLATVQFRCRKLLPRAYERIAPQCFTSRLLSPRTALGARPERTAADGKAAKKPRRAEGAADGAADGSAAAAKKAKRRQQRQEEEEQQQRASGSAGEEGEEEEEEAAAPSGQQVRRGERAGRQLRSAAVRALQGGLPVCNSIHAAFDLRLPDQPAPHP